MIFDLGAAAGAGLIGGAVMSALLYMGVAMMPRPMKMNLFPMLGTSDRRVYEKKLSYLRAKLWSFGS